MRDSFSQSGEHLPQLFFDVPLRAAVQEPEALPTAHLHGAKERHVADDVTVVIVAEKGQRLQRQKDLRRVHLGARFIQLVYGLVTESCLRKARHSEGQWLEREMIFNNSTYALPSSIGSCNGSKLAIG